MIWLKTLSWAIPGCSSKFAGSPCCSISWTWEWQSRNVLSTFSFLYLHLCCLTAIKCQTTCFIKQIVLTCCLSSGKSLWSLEQSQHPEEVLASHPHLNQHLEICQPLGSHPFHPKSLKADQTWPASLKGQALAGAQRYTIKWGSNCKLNYNFLKQPTEITIVERANVGSEWIPW